MPCIFLLYGIKEKQDIERVAMSPFYYAVLFPDLPGCNTEGSTMEGAFAMDMEAVSGHMEAMADDGDAIPAPSSKDEAQKKLREQYAKLGFGALPEGTELHPVPPPARLRRIRKGIFDEKRIAHAKAPASAHH